MELKLRYPKNPNGQNKQGNKSQGPEELTRKHTWCRPCAGGQTGVLPELKANPLPPPSNLSPFCNSGSSSKMGTNDCPSYLPHRGVVRTSAQVNECSVRFVDTGV